MFTKLVLGLLMIILFMSMLCDALECANKDINNEIISNIQYVLVFIRNLATSFFIVFSVINILVD